MATLNIPAVPSFELGGNDQGERWKMWMEDFEFYIAALAVNNDEQKKALLLHLAGLEVRTVFKTLTSTGNTYKDTSEALSKYFTPKVNPTFERHQFRKARQTSEETLDSFVTRLRKLALTCQFADNTEDHIRDQVIDACYDLRLRRRFLREDNPGLEALLKIARVVERSEDQAKRMEETKEAVKEAAYAVRAKVTSHQSQQHPNRKYEREKYNRYDREQKMGSGHKMAVNTSNACLRCGNESHKSRDCKVAMGKTCHKCGKQNHLASVCMSTSNKIEGRQNNHQSQEYGNKQRSQTSANDSQKVRALHTEVNTQMQLNDDDSDEYVFTLKNSETADITVRINNVPTPMLIDSGSTVGMITKSSWDIIAANTNGKLYRSNTRVFPFGAMTPVKLDGKISAELSIHGKSVQSTIVVTNVEGPNLLGRTSAEELGVLRLKKDTDLLTNHMQTKTMCENAELKNILAEHKDLFQGLGKLKNFQLRLPIDTNADLGTGLPCRIPFHLRSQVEEEIKRLVAMDVLEEVKGPVQCRAKVVVVPKGSGVRLCLHLDKVNKALVRRRHSIPTIDETIESMNESTVFSKLDLNFGYHQIELEEKSRDLTLFATHNGIYRYKRLGFGIATASEEYQALIEQVLKGTKGAKNVSDDIAVHGNGIVQHNKRLRAVLQTLKRNGLTLNKTKCLFGMPKVQFLGLIISAAGIALPEEKISAVTEAPRPETVTELRSFLGLTNYCARFICGYATAAEPLQRLTRSTEEWYWGKEQDDAFKKLKDMLVSTPVLAFHNKNAQTTLVVDASPVGLGAVLLQQNDAGEKHPIAFASKTLTKTEQNYSQTEKEGLAVVWGIERFKLFLCGTKFQLITDHKSLEFIFNKQRTRSSLRLERWILRLQPYDFVVQHKPGSQNIADFLSRRVAPNTPTRREASHSEVAEAYTRFIAQKAAPVAVTTQKIKEATETDNELANVIRALCDETQWDESCAVWQRYKDEITVVDGLVMRNNRIVIPKTLRKNILQLAHADHAGIVRMKQRLRDKVWWHGINKDAEDMVRKCSTCQQLGKAEKSSPMYSTPMPEGPWKQLAADICGPFPNGQYILSMIDYYSRWPEAKLSNTTKTRDVIKWMKSVFSLYGMPDSIKTDNGPQFTSQEFKDFLAEYGVKHKTSTPYYPQANGLVERLNQLYIKAFKAAQIEGKSAQDALEEALFGYRTTNHSTMGHTPAELLFGRKLKTKLPSAKDKNKQNESAILSDKHKKEKSKEYTDCKRGARFGTVKVNDSVLIRQKKTDKLSPSFAPNQWQVIKVFGGQLLLKDGKMGRIIRRNISQIKKVNTEDNTIPKQIEDDDLDDWKIQDLDVTGQAGAEGRPRRTRNQPRRFLDYVM